MFGIVSDESFESQLEDLKKPSPRANVVNIQRGRNGKDEVPIEIKKVIAEESLLGTPAKELAKQFSVSEASISAYKNGATSTATYDKPNTELVKSNEEVKERISGIARGRLITALEQITDEKLAASKVRDVASIAKDMSAIIRNMDPSENTDRNLNQQFIFMTPHPREEKSFEVIEVRD